MKKKILLILLIIIVISLTSCSFSTSNDASIVEDNNTVTNSTNSSLKDKSEETLYASDEVINGFISSFNNSAQTKMINIRQGNIRTKYLASANDCYIEMINSSNGFYISINGGTTEETKHKMFSVVVEMIKVLEPSLSDAKIDSIINQISNEKYMVKNQNISQNIIIETYVPIVELSYGKSDCRVDLVVYNYN
jgi:hypothetical protein